MPQINCIPDPIDPALRETELSDHLRISPEFNFNGVNLHDGPPIMEMHDMEGRGKANIKTGIEAKLMPRAEVFKKWETESKVPFWQNYNKIEKGRNAAAEAFIPIRSELSRIRSLVKNRDDRTNIQLLFEARAGGYVEKAKALADKMSPENVKHSQDVETAWSKFFTDQMGWTDEDLKAGFSQFPQMRKLSGDFKAYVGPRSALPRMQSMLRRVLSAENSPLKIDERETDFYSLGVRLSRALSMEKHLREPWNDAARNMELYANKIVEIPPDAFNFFKTYMHEAMHTPDDVSIAASRTIRRGLVAADEAMSRITGGKLGFKWAISDQESFDYVSAIQNMSYSANLAWNPSTVIQQFMQTVQTTLPMLGPKYTKRGMGYGMRWLKDPVLRDDMMRRGITSSASTGQGYAIADEAFGGHGNVITSNVGHALSKFSETGTKLFQKGDDFNRVVAYMGKNEAVREHGLDYMNGKIDFETFRENTGLDLDEKRNSPVTEAIKHFLDAKDLQTAAHVAGDNFQKITQFVYGRGNAPSILEGTVGRLFGQYGTYPLGMLNYFNRLAFAGDRVLTKNKVRAFATIFAVSEGLMGAMNEMFDGDASKWTVYNSWFFRGGPYADIADNLLHVGSALANGNAKFENGSMHFDDPQGAVSWGRLKSIIPAQFIPGTAGAKHFYNAADAMRQGDEDGAFRALLGIQQTKGAK